MYHQNKRHYRRGISEKVIYCVVALPRIKADTPSAIATKQSAQRQGCGRAITPVASA